MRVGPDTRRERWRNQELYFLGEQLTVIAGKCAEGGRRLRYRGIGIGEERFEGAVLGWKRVSNLNNPKGSEERSGKGNCEKTRRKSMERRNRKCSKRKGLSR